MVLGIASLVGLLVVVVVPFALITAPLGLGIGVVALVRKAPRRGRAIAGVVCSSIATFIIGAGIVALLVVFNNADFGPPSDSSVSIGVVNDCSIPIRARFYALQPGETLGVGDAFSEDYSFMAPGGGYLASIVYWDELPKGQSTLVVESSDALLVERPYEIADVARGGSLVVRGMCSGRMECAETEPDRVECVDP